MVKKLDTEKAHIWWALGIILGAIAKTFLDAFPFIEFASVWTFGFLGVGGKRLFEKHEKFRTGA
ncbi:unnamed protein product [marine sediment metagenome]|uniref:Uncharacterized protein n=1 Tax=marine sediment metagenome TaxID=412755 RepID=X1G5V0_9ZZZZ